MASHSLANVEMQLTKGGGVVNWFLSQSDNGVTLQYWNKEYYEIGNWFIFLSIAYTPHTIKTVEKQWKDLHRFIYCIVCCLFILQTILQFTSRTANWSHFCRNMKLFFLPVFHNNSHILLLHNEWQELCLFPYVHHQIICETPCKVCGKQWISTLWESYIEAVLMLKSSIWYDC